MQNNQGMEAELLKSMSRDELEGLVAGKIQSFHGLLTREVALRLIAKEKGVLRDEEREYALAGIPPGAKKIRFTAAVRKIWPAVTYSSGKRSRVVEVTDAEHGTGGTKPETVKPLVLWNEDVELAKGLRTRDRIAVRGAYEKGGELHLGYSGAMEVVHKAPFTPLDSLEEGREAHIRGVISAIEGHGSFVRNGRTVRGFSFTVSDGNSERRCVMLEGLGRADRLKVGDEVLIEDAVVSRGNIDLSAGRLLTRRKSEMLLGRIMRLDVRGGPGQGAGGAAPETLLLDVEGRELVLDRESALRLMGVEAAPDIALSTVVSLKKDFLINSRIALRVSQKEGRAVIA